MRRLLALLMSAALALTSIAPAAAQPITPPKEAVIHVYSDVLTVAELTKVIAAIQIQIDRDFTPAWGYHARLTLKDGPGEWQMNLSNDDSIRPDGCFCWGRHDIQDGSPVGFVYLKMTKEYPIPYTMVLSHEILEMLADPYVDQVIYIDGQPVGIEVGDATRTYGYRINGILVQDFLLPAYFVPGAAGPYDFLRLLKGPYPECDIPGCWGDKVKKDLPE